MIAPQLLQAEGSVRREVAASQRAWSMLDRGLPAHPDGRLLSAVSAASAAARATLVPSFTAEAEMEGLIGPAARVARLYRSFLLLTARGWQHVQTAVTAVRGHAPTASFWRENVDLYLTSVYDGNFDVSLIGEKVKGTYERLGEGAELGSALTQAQVHSIEVAYSPQADQMRPHEWEALAAGRP